MNSSGRDFNASLEGSPLSRGGKWLFEHRAWIPAPCVVGCFWLIQPLQIWTGVGIGMVAIAVVVRFWSVVHMGPEARMRTANVSKLIYTGPYELTRNPMYLANIVLMAGFGVAAGGPMPGVGLGVAMVAIYNVIVRFEEDFLERRLGEIYRSYRNRVPRWLGEAAPVHAAAPKGIMSERVRDAYRAERSTLLLSSIVTLMVLIRAATLG